MAHSAPGVLLPADVAAAQEAVAGGDADGSEDADGINKHAQFCDKVGLRAAGRHELPGSPGSPGSPRRAPFLEPIKHGYYYEINRAYTYHTWQYWFVASLINTLHLSQIIIGATATALGGAGVRDKASLRRTTAITVLTTIMTVIAALLAYFKSRGQPNRVRQFRNDLRKVCDYIKFTEIAFRDPAFGPSVQDALKEVKNLYDTARANAETNYPDTWSAAPVAPVARKP